ncbi:MAG: hypothetical protein Q4E29_08250 [Lachnospiraceae bacterium]|nr:hypothetical protein [Lachnospiraceae bacterium]
MKIPTDIGVRREWHKESDDSRWQFHAGGLTPAGKRCIFITIGAITEINQSLR